MTTKYRIISTVATVLCVTLVVSGAYVYLIRTFEALRMDVRALHGELQDVRQEQEILRGMLEGLQEEVETTQDVLDNFLGGDVIEVLATAYTHVATPGVQDINGNGDGLTAIGLPVQEGLIAVDPKVIPLRSLVWVEGFGVMRAADTGGWIKGNRIDIFFEDRQAANIFGRRELRVVVL